MSTKAAKRQGKANRPVLALDRCLMNWNSIGRRKGTIPARRKDHSLDEFKVSESNVSANVNNGDRNDLNRRLKKTTIASERLQRVNVEAGKVVKSPINVVFGTPVEAEASMYRHANAHDTSDLLENDEAEYRGVTNITVGDVSIVYLSSNHICTISGNIKLLRISEFSNHFHLLLFKDDSISSPPYHNYNRHYRNLQLDSIFPVLHAKPRPIHQLLSCAYHWDLDIPPHSKITPQLRSPLAIKE
ncbi:hypothetical protein LXL04_022730 [Taraxacum kok-saghyz]